MRRRIQEFTDTLFLRGRGVSMTTQDLIKSFALVIMIIDHIGYLFVPDDLTWRAIGRWGLPVWFFLAGYHTPKRWLEPSLLIGGIILAAAFLIFMDSALPLNALFSIQIVHIQTRLLMRSSTTNWNGSFTPLLIYIAFLAALAPVTSLFWQYGTTALLFGVWGFFTKHRQSLSNGNYNILMLITAMAVIGLQLTRMPFSLPDSLLCGLGMAATMVYLSWFMVARTYTGVHSALLRIGGRYTLELYVLHLIAFLALYTFLKD